LIEFEAQVAPWRAGGSVVSIRQFEPAAVADLFELADRLRERPAAAQDLARGRIMATLFYEPSTRTRLSFEAAMARLGGQVVSTENAASMSSAVKGESLADTVRIVSGYADVIVLRHHEAGSAQVAAAAADVPVLNAGDGPGEHPTQALLDAYTIERRVGRLDHLNVVLVGDMAYGRTAHSLSLLLADYPGQRITFVAPPVARAPAPLVAALRRRGADVRESEDFLGAIADCDVLYMTRVQKERFPSPELYAAAQGRYTLDAAALAALPARAWILHPLPRLGELPEAVDADPRAIYFEQARNGVPIRMALLARALTLA
jgi:aspartate carbamoyltransferase catalytic subunit